MTKMRVVFVVALLLAAVCAGCEPPLAQNSARPDNEVKPAEARPAVGAGARYALLVGCTKYPNLTTGFQLRGPANDVVLMRRLLVDRFGFPEKNIVTLSEEAGGEDKRPTRANIKCEFERLAEMAKPGDQVVILLSGHGSQQPDEYPPQPDDPEPDGLDETFLPADVGSWDDSKQVVTNAIIDDELRAWTKNILQKKASLWVIADACHSGTLLRGGPEEVAREVPANKLVPEEVLKKARERAAEFYGQSRGAKPEEQSPFKMAETPALVGIYASQSSEPTFEKNLPPDTPDAKPYGLLTYTLCQVLEQATTPLTYRELVQRIRAQYVHWGRTYPTPLVEGKDQDREVLGVAEWPGRSRFLLNQDEEGAWKVSGGTLQGLTENSILAVYPPAGQANADKLLGHVRIRASRLLDAQVEPCAHAETPAPKDLPIGGRCEPVHMDYGSLRIRVALDQPAAAVEEPARSVEKNRLGKELQKLASEPGSLIEVVSEPAKANWLVRFEGGKVYLVPVEEARTRGARPESPLFGPVLADEKMLSWLKKSLGKIARAENLKRLATAPANDVVRSGAGVAVDVELVQYRSKSDKEGQVVRWQSNGLTLRDGDLIGFRVHNRSRDKKIYATLLFVDSGHGIQSLYPEEGDVVEPLPPGGSFATPVLKVSSKKTAGLEHLVAIAVKAGREPVDFSCLEQPSIERARGNSASSSVLETPLGRLFQNALYAEGGASRGLEKGDLEDHAFRLLSWQTLPAKREAEKK